MTKLDELQIATKKNELADLIGVKPSFLTNILYVLKPSTQYEQFEVAKRNGGKRVISAPTDKLKSIQSGLSTLLLDCIDDINAIKYPNSQIKNPKLLKPKIPDASAGILKVKISNAMIKQPSLAHGFVRDRSILTNAMMHLNKKNVLNIDLENFFDSFNFGRVRGFFIKNKNFNLNPDIATVIAQIACYDNKLPQGSPCSPVITNLITHSLDIRLASLAKKNSCTYTRYADDITFSTNKSVFPRNVMRQENEQYIPGKKLKSEINRAGFAINNKKTRIQYKDSRQDVTGLIVNKKPNVKNEYWRTVRSQCHSLFRTGGFVKYIGGEAVDGNINELEGQLAFIDQVDHYNRLRQKPALNRIYAIKRDSKKNLKDSQHLHNGRERTFFRFLYYRLFYGNDKPTILCEGKTDNVYLKAAISELVDLYPKLALPVKEDKKYKLLLKFVEYSKRTRFLLELYGGASYLKNFIENYSKQYSFYKGPNPSHPVIIILDNDDGPKEIISYLLSIRSLKLFPQQKGKQKNIRSANFIHVMHNLYIVLTPQGTDGGDTDIEYFFDAKTREMKYQNKCFNLVDKRNKELDLSKEAFSSHIVKAQKKSINFDGLKPLLDRVVLAVEHYDLIKKGDAK